MAPPPEASCRLYAILARDGRSAVVFRRGPSRQVLTLRWWLDSDVLEEGQWLKGRIYERRGDLSPDGELMIYMAAKWAGPLETWTAVSRAPYLKALALWKGYGSWGGGGVFQGPRKIGVNLRTLEAVRPKGSTVPWHPLDGDEQTAELPRGYSAERVAEWAGGGEDDPICHHRMSRDGWRMISEGEAGRYGEDEGYAWLLKAPEIVERLCPVAGPNGQPLALRRELKAIGQRDGPWYVEDFLVRRSDGTVLRLLADCGWADWHVNGDLLFALGGRLYRLPARHAADEAADPLENAKLVADLAPLTFRPRAAPKSASDWPVS